MSYRLFSLRILRPLAAVLFLFFLSCAASASDEEKKSTLPDTVESALGSILAAAPANSQLSLEAVDTLLRFVVGAEHSGEKVLQATREHGTSAFLRQNFNVPLRDIVRYLLNPQIPGAILYPNSVRNASWLPGSQILTAWRTFTSSPLPPSSPLIVHGIEEEETTPDTSSGCTYSYKLNRMFILTSIDGRAALLSVSVMPEPSAYGHKGVLIQDRDWRYLYTKEIGTNLPMLGWAKTTLYGSASILVYMESAPRSAHTTLSVFKWTKAGWSGMNAVKTVHIEEGIKRFAAGMRQFLESPRRPSPNAVAAEAARLNAMDDKGLRAVIASFIEELKNSNCNMLKKNPYKELLETDYAASLSRKGLIAEALRVYLRRTIQP